MTTKKKKERFISKNKRNRLINRAYLSKIKFMDKYIREKLHTFSNLYKGVFEILTPDLEKSMGVKKKEIQTYLFQALPNFYHWLDKGVKKKVIHKNKAIRKKKRLIKKLQSISQDPILLS